MRISYSQKTLPNVEQNGNNGIDHDSDRSQSIFLTGTLGVTIIKYL